MTDAESARLTGRSRPVHRDVASVELDGSICLVDERGAPTVLSPTASLIWSQLDGQITLDELIDDLDAVFDPPRHVLAEDVLRTVTELVEMELVAESRDVGRSAPSPADDGSETEDCSEPLAAVEEERGRLRYRRPLPFPCGTEVENLGWTPTLALGLAGGRRLGLRASSSELHDVVRELFAAHVVDDQDVHDNFGVRAAVNDDAVPRSRSRRWLRRLGGVGLLAPRESTGTATGAARLYEGWGLLVQDEAVTTVLRALTVRLGQFLPFEDRPGGDVRRLPGSAVVGPDGAVLVLPHGVSAVDHAAPELARAGLHVVRGDVQVDIGTTELVLPAMPFDESVLDEVAQRESATRVPALDADRSRYPLVGMTSAPRSDLDAGGVPPRVDALLRAMRQQTRAKPAHRQGRLEVMAALSGTGAVVLESDPPTWAPTFIDAVGS